MSETRHPSRATSLQIWLRWLLLLGPILYFFAAAYVIFRRINYPYELEWMEGGSLIEVLRLLQGKPVYVSPSLNYIAYIYPPFYYYLSALFMKISGEDWFLPLRLVSVLATLGTLFFIFRIVQKQTHSRYWGVIAAGLFAACFRLGGAWFDIARVDMLYIFLMTAGTYLLLANAGMSFIFSGLLFALAFYTKQTAVLPALAVILYLLLTKQWRKALLFGLPFLGISLLVFGIEYGLSKGWYSYYIFYLPSLHRIPSPAWLALFANAAALLGALVIAVAISLIPFIASPIKSWQEKNGLLGLIAVAALFVSVSGNAQPGGYENANLPALAMIPILASLGGNWLETMSQGKNRWLILSALSLLFGIQFIMLHYSVLAQIPDNSDRRAGDQIVSAIQNTPGEVLVPFHGYLALKAGKSPSAHQVMLWLISGNFGEADRSTWSRLSSEIDGSIRAQLYQRILLDRSEKMWAEVPQYYIGSIVDYPRPSTFIPVTGGRARPNLDYTPKQP